jgi:hypothetical protein
MNRQGYIKIMQAVANLIIVIMTEAGKVPVDSARKVGDAFMQAVTGKPGEKK